MSQRGRKSMMKLFLSKLADQREHVQRRGNNMASTMTVWVDRGPPPGSATAAEEWLTGIDSELSLAGLDSGDEYRIGASGSGAGERPAMRPRLYRRAEVVRQW